MVVAGGTSDTFPEVIDTHSGVIIMDSPDCSSAGTTGGAPAHPQQKVTDAGPGRAAQEQASNPKTHHVKVPAGTGD